MKSERREHLRRIASQKCKGGFVDLEIEITPELAAALGADESERDLAVVEKLRHALKSKARVKKTATAVALLILVSTSPAFSFEIPGQQKQPGPRLDVGADGQVLKPQPKPTQAQPKPQLKAEQHCAPAMPKVSAYAQDAGGTAVITGTPEMATIKKLEKEYKKTQSEHIKQTRWRKFRTRVVPTTQFVATILTLIFTVARR